MPTTNIYDIAATWNNGATTFTGIKLNVTDTASASGSLLMDLQVGGSSKFNVGKNGVIYVGGQENARITGQAVGISLGGSNIRAFVGGTNSAGAHGIYCGAVGVIGFSSSNNPTSASYDVGVFRDAANTLAQRNGVNAQAYNIYNTYTDASNYERVSMGWSGNVFSISAGAAGTGVTRVIHISGLPTSNPGPGILWNNSGVVNVGT